MVICRAAKVLLLPVVLAAAPVSAQQTFTPTQALAFGRFVAGTGGTITVSPSGARSPGGGVVTLASPASAASFTFTDTDPAHANNACIITLPPDDSVVLTSDAHQMKLSAFTSNPSDTGVLSGGTLRISVGATLTVGLNQASGNYSGSIPITIQYQ